MLTHIDSRKFRKHAIEIGEKVDDLLSCGCQFSHIVVFRDERKTSACWLVDYGRRRDETSGLERSEQELTEEHARVFVPSAADFAECSICIDSYRSNFHQSARESDVSELWRT